MSDNERALEQIDSFPYRHRVREVMSSPVSVARPRDTLVSGCRTMADKGISSLVVVDDHGKALGIVTERDVLRAVARSGGIGMQLPLGSVMSSPVAAINAGSHIYIALGRMNRLNIRHLLAVDDAGLPVGMVTARSLLKMRATPALAIGDEIDNAPDGVRMGEVRKKIPGLASALLASGVDCAGLSGVIGAMLRDMTGRAALLAEQSMLTDGWGQAPFPWCLLILGSGGRGESLLGAAQKTALVHGGRAVSDTWYAELGRRLSAILAEAGIPPHSGNVTAGNPDWRRGLESWKEAIGLWAGDGSEADLDAAEIFFDFQGAYGNHALAEDLREFLIRHAASSPRLQRRLALAMGEAKEAFGMFGQLATDDDHLDLEAVGLSPLVAAVRTLAARHGIAATSTVERLRLLVDGGHLASAEGQALIETHDWLLRLILEQQLRDAEEHRPPTGLVWPDEFDKDRRTRLKSALRYVNSLGGMVKEAISA